MGFFEFLQANFLHVLPILIAGGFAVAIIVERVRTLFVTYPMQNTQEFFAKLGELLVRGKTPEAIALCDQHIGKPVAQIAKSGLMRAHLPEELITHGLELSVGEATQAIQKRTSFLATIANVATLLGLFGTILGLIHSFEAVGHADAQQKSALLAAGISTAMNATMMGLGVAIPCMIAFSFLINRSNRMVAELEHSAVRTMDILRQRFYSIDSAGAESIDSQDSARNEPLRAESCEPKWRRPQEGIMSSMGGGHGSGGQDFELQLAPIIDCFTVLIAFMLVSASFLSIGLIDAGIAGGAVTTQVAPPPVDVTIALKKDKGIEIRLSGKVTQTLPVAAKDGQWNQEALKTQLDKVHTQWPSIAAATMVADSEVEYLDIISTMDTVRKVMPDVLLGGF